MQDPQKRQFNFLVVDDSEFARKSLIKMLATMGGKLVGEAMTGQDAIMKYRSLKPDIVFMDITMPGMEGIDALEEIMRDDRSAKVVMVSSLGHNDLVKDALRKGARHFITKPVQNVPLEEILSFVLTQ